MMTVVVIMVVMTLTPYYDVDDELEKEDKPLVPSLTCHECAERNVLLKPFFLANSPDMVDNRVQFF